MSNDDCYFYYYSTCAKGSACPFRHEPAALAQEVVCSFWQAGSCSKPHCIFRHLDVSASRRKVTSCYYETQPGGCRKPHCPFLHEKPKDPYPTELTEMLEKPTQKIFVNKNKIGQLSQLILPVMPSRISAKARLGPTMQTTVPSRLGSVKDRLGDFASVAVYECSEGEEDLEVSVEEKALRASAIKTLDLRKRLDTRRDALPADYSNDSGDEFEAGTKKIKSVVKKVKREKKDKKKKKEKKEKKREKRSKRLDKEVAPEGEQQKRIVKRLSSTPPPSSDDDLLEEEEKNMSLADRIAARREGELASVDKKTRRQKSAGSPTRVSVARKRVSEVLERSPKKKKRLEDQAKYSAIGNRKLKVRSKEAHGNEDTTGDTVDDLERFLKENPEVDAAASSSLDVMKELDELLKD